MTLIALFLPGPGILNRYVNELLRPGVRPGRVAAALLLLVAGAFVERAPSAGTGWGVSALGGLVTFLGGIGLFHLVWGQGRTPDQLRNGGGWLGSHAVGSALTDLVSAPGAFVVLLGLLLAGIVLLLNVTVRGLLNPVVSGGRAVAGALAAARRRRAGPTETRARATAARHARRGGARPRRTADERDAPSHARPSGARPQPRSHEPDGLVR